MRIGIYARVSTKTKVATFKYVISGLTARPVNIPGRLASTFWCSRLPADPNSHESHILCSNRVQFGKWKLSRL